MKLIFTGSQGTGKSTILNNTPIANKITEVVRSLSKEGVKINRDGDADGQLIIFEAYKELLTQKGDWVSDRGLTDVLAYTIYLQMNASDDDKRAKLTNVMLSQMEDLVKYNKKNPDVMYVYFPIEFGVVGDGVRDTDEVYRADIDSLIVRLLDISGAHYITIHGSVEERIDTIYNLLGE